MDSFLSHASVRLRGTADTFEPNWCTAQLCPQRAVAKHLHCPFCPVEDIFHETILLKAHYRVKHVDKGIDFAGLQVLRCCDNCSIQGSIKSEKSFRGCHWHCFRCKNGFNRRDEAIKHYRTHFRNPKTAFQIHITEDLNEAIRVRCNTKGSRQPAGGAALVTGTVCVQVGVHQEQAGASLVLVKQQAVCIQPNLGAASLQVEQLPNAGFSVGSEDSSTGMEQQQQEINTFENQAVVSPDAYLSNNCPSPLCVGQVTVETAEEKPSSYRATTYQSKFILPASQALQLGKSVGITGDGSTATLNSQPSRTKPSVLQRMLPKSKDRVIEEEIEELINERTHYVQRPPSPTQHWRAHKRFLETQCDELKDENKRLKVENAGLRQKLAAFQAKLYELLQEKLPPGAEDKQEIILQQPPGQAQDFVEAGRQVIIEEDVVEQEERSQDESWGGKEKVIVRYNDPDLIEDQTIFLSPDSDENCYMVHSNQKSIVKVTEGGKMVYYEPESVSSNQSQTQSDETESNVATIPTILSSVSTNFMDATYIINSESSDSQNVAYASTSEESLHNGPVQNSTTMHQYIVIPPPGKDVTEISSNFAEEIAQDPNFKIIPVEYVSDINSDAELREKLGIFQDHSLSEETLPNYTETMQIYVEETANEVEYSEEAVIAKDDVTFSDSQEEHLPNKRLKLDG